MIGKIKCILRNSMKHTTYSLCVNLSPWITDGNLKGVPYIRNTPFWTRFCFYLCVQDSLCRCVLPRYLPHYHSSFINLICVAWNHDQGNLEQWDSFWIFLPSNGQPVNVSSTRVILSSVPQKPGVSTGIIDIAKFLWFLIFWLLSFLKFQFAVFCIFYMSNIFMLLFKILSLKYFCIILLWTLFSLIHGKQ
jgi:hypothetical protein